MSATHHSPRKLIALCSTLTPVGAGVAFRVLASALLVQRLVPLAAYEGPTSVEGLCSVVAQTHFLLTKRP